MSKRRKIQFREALDAKREALASAAKQRKPELEEERTRQSIYRGIARTYGVEQSELISRLDTLATRKRKA